MGDRDAAKVILGCDGISKTLSSGGRRLSILHNLGLEVRAGESLAILGRSGSGKTTLLSLLAGFDLPDNGTVELFGEALSSLDEDGRAALRERHLGFVFQSFHLMPSFSALENVMLPLEIQGAHDARKRAQELLDRVGMRERADHYPRALSGGEQQRVAIARAFAPTPPLLLADEPTGNLDQETGRTIIDLLFELNAESGTTLVLVTHDQALAERCSRRYLLRDGALRPC